MNIKWLTCAAISAVSTASLANSDKPNFVNGDCVQRTADIERWDEPEPILKILEVGRKKYRIAEWNSKTKKFDPNWASYPFFIIDNFNTKVRCPK